MKGLFSLLLILAALAPSLASASTFDVTGWIPYWAVAQGTQDALNHLDKLTSIHPFSYSVKQDGTIQDLADMASSSWVNLLKAAKKKGVAIIPTVMWSDTNAIARILSDSKLRSAHIQNIADLVRQNSYDGVNIDYEGKLASTRDSFSEFLKELKQKIGSKTLVCSIEARTPPGSLYKVIPSNLEYANDYAAIGQYCDRVELMTYDQGRVDILLNATKAGSPYIPVADPDWVKKVINVALQSIPRSKIMLGIPTYGREYSLTVSPNWFQSYQKIRSVEPADALATASSTGAMPARNKAGELSFTYPMTAAQALSQANKTGKSLTINLVWWTDAKAVADKVALAKQYGLAGVALFKLDGGEDQDLWKTF